MAPVEATLDEEEAPSQNGSGRMKQSQQLTLIPLGSGGNDGDGTSSGARGKGGGSIKITSTIGDIEGMIQANGIDAEVSKSGGGGAGGSILLDCQQLSGRPTMEANGGQGDGEGGGGSGGRISVQYRTGLVNGEIGIHAHSGKTGEWLLINVGVINNECMYYAQICSSRPLVC
eukprot:Seg1743.5 transcript_id=Seg1743.5/GoldUCD/mRNA.D3Y31 product="hypothetical protein" protein_id=Seg1743.5/GoldUCD/D3Y31